MASDNQEGVAMPQAGQAPPPVQTQPQPAGSTAAPLLVVEEEKAPFLPPPAPVREDFVQNAVNFLQHPNVKGSPVKFRRSFLEKKGLTADEIDEAFRRVPDAPTGDASVDASSTATTPPVSNAVRTVRIPAQQQTSQPVQAAQQQQQQYGAPAQQYALQPVGAAPAQLGTGQLYAPVQAQLMPPASGPLAPAPAGMRWTQMILALGVIGAGGAATALLAQKYALPTVQGWLHKLASATSEDAKRKMSPADEAAAAAASAATAAASATKELVQARAEEKERTDALVKALEVQTAELRSALASLRDALPAAKPGADSDPNITVADLRKELRNFANVITDFTPAPSASAAHREAPAGLQSELAEIKQLLQASSQAKANGPILAVSPASATTQVPVLDASSNTAVSARPGSAPPNGRSDQPQHPQSYMEVLEMVQRGEKPPGIRDINDKPPDPTRPISDASMAPRPKPWERGATAVAPQSLSASWHASPGGGAASFMPRSPSATTDGTPGTTAAAAASPESTPWWYKRNPQAPYGGRPAAPSAQAAPVQYDQWGAPVYTVAPPRAAAAAQTSPSVGIAEVDESRSQAESVPGEGPGSSSGLPQGGPVTASGSSASSGTPTTNDNGTGAQSWGRPGWVPPPVPQPAMPEAAAAMRARPQEKDDSFNPFSSQKTAGDEPQEPYADGSALGARLSDGAGGSSMPNGGAGDVPQVDSHENGSEVSAGPSQVDAEA